MDNRFTKYSKLYFLIFGLFLTVPLFLALTIAFFYGFFKVFASKPLDIFYEIVIMILPPAFFAAVHYIFFRRSQDHTAKIIRTVSRVLLALAFCCCVAILAADMITYFKLGPNTYEVTNFKSFSLLFLAGNIALLFIVALVQAFSTKKEEDWLEKRKRRQNNNAGV